ncbi:MAG: hypothetical protein CBARDCOR_6076 [uncultured Caballeronia sp.]|nr:MAG: hypothetical protein CBARDCOR_6076 [uncultured Caballeronia sp.]
MKKYPLDIAAYYVLSVLVLVLVLVVALFPFVYMVGTSLKHGEVLFDTSLLPSRPSLDKLRAAVPRSTVRRLFAQFCADRGRRSRIITRCVRARRVCARSAGYRFAVVAC